MSLDMNPEIRAQWCAALRSGEYPQTKEALRRLPEEIQQGGHPAYCCLGVLTDLYIKAGNDEMVAGDEFLGAGDGEPASVWASVEGSLALAVMEWAGLTDRDPELRPGLHGNAVFLNDEGHTFAEIADLIDGGAP